ncbi:bifunctional serine/threonine-protein kinase/universal stress protein [Roseomonas sp. OT10]|uniref:bifunctional serine/threonine-protein kinase/universal stress protein n=1 Tax=Roseomonas cutis TaxID=2897332 RepID=UPI001E4F3833|nr:bifunctional serine/threonine-protein kinase/universal stress protein [Roseomonas sp. OT10]UFN49602.1 bifunctional serine/threonine-protein kinase/universal stress protein [Roseomonas sp. OT10]
MPAASLRAGQVLDGFELERVLHEGGMAALWSVTHPDHPGPLLMKVPRLAASDPGAIVSFEMEQMVLPRLSGPHVPRFIAAVGFEAEPYLVMECLPGASLLARRREFPLPVAEVAAIGARVATALDSVHRQHVLHLDVKPANILFRPPPAEGGEPVAVLVDFGLSHHALLPDLIEEEFRLPYGTAPYMAPEQVLGTRSEPRSDLYALGVTLYYLATGVLPFGDPQHIAAVRKRLWRDPLPPRRLRPDLPPWLQEVILRSLEVQPSARHPTAAQLAFALRHPDSVPLTARAERQGRDGPLAVLRRRIAAPSATVQGRPLPRPPAPPGPAGRPGGPAGPAAGTQEARLTPAWRQLVGAPIVMVAVDLSAEGLSLADPLRNTIGQVLRLFPGARLACVNVLRQGLLLADPAVDSQGRSSHVERLVQLRHWARPLRLSEEQVTFHVLEAGDAATALLDYATANHVDHIVMGARANSLRRAMLGSVSGEVAAKAPCTVTVVRPRMRA